MTLLSVRDLAVHFPGRGKGTDGAVRAVDGVSFELEAGETLGLVGESGCGKSTVARAIVGLAPVTRGSIRLDGHELVGLGSREWAPWRRRVQMIFQDPFASLDPRQAVGSIVEEPLRIHRVGTRRERKLKVMMLLEAVGLNPRHALRYPHEFSGGQRQRIGIARALALEPDLIICDEPVSALDVSIQAQIINQLRELQERFSLAYLFIAHDLAVVRHLCPRVAVMYLGRLAEVGPREALFEQTRHPYTEALLSAIPVPDPKEERARQRVVLTGDVPSPASPPTGCFFHPRCPRRGDLSDPTQCESEAPALESILSEGAPPGEDSSHARPEHRSACHGRDTLFLTPEIEDKTPGASSG